MRGAKILTISRWASAFINVTLHCCTPARAIEIVTPHVVMTVPGDDASFDHTFVAPAATRFYVLSGLLDMPRMVPGLSNQGPMWARGF